MLPQEPKSRLWSVRLMIYQRTAQSPMQCLRIATRSWKIASVCCITCFRFCLRLFIVLYLGELESLLRQKDSATANSHFDTTPTLHDPRPSMSGPSNSSQSSLSLSEQFFPGASTATLSLMTNDAYDPQLDLHDVSPLIPAHISPVTSPPLESTATLDHQHQPGLNYTTQVLWPNWPHKLPTLDLLQHL